MAQTQDLLVVAQKAAKAGAAVALRYFQSPDLQTDTKKDGTPVTQADREVEAVVTKVITKHFPDHAIIGEESGNNLKDSEYSWIVDPIDGTRYFARGLPYFSIEIAVLHHTDIVAAVSFAPALDQLLTAEKNKGSYLNHTQKLQVSSISSLDKVFASAGSIKHFTQLRLLENLSTLNSAVSQLRGLEEARMYRLVAEGTLDAVLMAKGYAWDYAAAELILREAGATVTNLTGKPLDYSSTKPMSFLVSNPKLHPKLLSFFV